MTAQAYLQPEGGYAALFPAVNLGDDLATALVLTGGKPASLAPPVTWAATITSAAGRSVLRLASRNEQTAVSETLAKLGPRDRATIYVQVTHGDRATLFRKVATIGPDPAPLVVRTGGIVCKARLDPLVGVDLRVFSRKLARKLGKIDAAVSSSQIGRAVDLVANINFAKLTPAQVERAVRQAMGDLRGVAPEVAKQWVAEMRRELLRIGASTKAAVSQRYLRTVAPALRLPEAKAIDQIAQQQGWFVRNQAGRRDDALSRRALEIVTEGLKNGEGRTEIGRRISTELPGMWQGMGQRYANVLAANAVSRARTYAELSTFTEAGVVYAEVQAVLDERTTDVCRFMDGQIVEVLDMWEIARSAATVRNPEDIYKVSPFMQVRTNPQSGMREVQVRSTGTPVAEVRRSGVGAVNDRGAMRGLLPGKFKEAGIGGPPYHHNCRSMLVPRMDIVQVPAGYGARAAAPVSDAPGAGAMGTPYKPYKLAGT